MSRRIHHPTLSSTVHVELGCANFLGSAHQQKNKGRARGRSATGEGAGGALGGPPATQNGRHPGEAPHVWTSSDFFRLQPPRTRHGAVGGFPIGIARSYAVPIEAAWASNDSRRSVCCSDDRSSAEKTRVGDRGRMLCEAPHSCLSGDVSEGPSRAGRFSSDSIDDPGVSGPPTPISRTH